LTGTETKIFGFHAGLALIDEAGTARTVRLAFFTQTLL
jgi:hypothetical protein